MVRGFAFPRYCALLSSVIGTRYDVRYMFDILISLVQVKQNQNTRRRQTSANAADFAKFFKLVLVRSRKNSRIRILIRINTKIECFLASETSHLGKNS